MITYTGEEVVSCVFIYGLKQQLQVIFCNIGLYDR
jgi:hypothetical protein